MYNADTSGLDANSNGINDSVEWKDWFISTHGITNAKTLGLTDPNGYWNKEWAGHQSEYGSTTGLWGQVYDYINTNGNADSIIGILVGYNVPGIWGVYSESGGSNSDFLRGGKSVASSLADMQPTLIGGPSGGTNYRNNYLKDTASDVTFHLCGFVELNPGTGSEPLTKASLIEKGYGDKFFLTARIDGPDMESAKDLTRRCLNITGGQIGIDGQTLWQDFFDERAPNVWGDWGGAVMSGHRDVMWNKFMFDGTTDVSGLPDAECNEEPCPEPISPSNDLAWMGWHLNNEWASDTNGDNIRETTRFTLCEGPVGARLFAFPLVSFAGVTLRSRCADTRPVLAFSPTAPENENYLTTDTPSERLSQFSFNALWPDCDGDGAPDNSGGFASIVGSATAEPGINFFPNVHTFLERIRDGATFAEAFFIASEKLHYNVEYVGDPFLKLPRPLPTDCNTNGVDDFLELVAGTAMDVNTNGIPDDCETDCDNDGISDACMLARSLDTDCANTGVPDSCELAAGTSTDLNTNGIPDNCEAPFVTYIAVLREHGPVGDLFIEATMSGPASTDPRISNAADPFKIEVGFSRPMDADAWADLIDGGDHPLWMWKCTVMDWLYWPVNETTEAVLDASGRFATFNNFRLVGNPSYERPPDDEEYLIVAHASINDLEGQQLQGDRTGRIIFLVGDVDGDGDMDDDDRIDICDEFCTTGTCDGSGVCSSSSDSVTTSQSTARYDVNVTTIIPGIWDEAGIIDATDVSTVNTGSGSFTACE